MNRKRVRFCYADGTWHITVSAPDCDEMLQKVEAVVALLDAAANAALN